MTMTIDSLIDIDSQVDTIEIAPVTVDVIGVDTGYGSASTPQVIEMTTAGVVDVADVTIGSVNAVDVILGPRGETGPTGATGEVGPVGPVGPAGPAGSAATISQGFAIADTTWEFVHNLGFRPFVMTYDSYGTVTTGVIEANTEVLTRVQWFYPMAGSMVLL